MPAGDGHSRARGRAEVFDRVSTEGRRGRHGGVVAEWRMGDGDDDSLVPGAVHDVHDLTGFPGGVHDDIVADMGRPWCVRLMHGVPLPSGVSAGA